MSIGRIEAFLLLPESKTRLKVQSKQSSTTNDGLTKLECTKEEVDSLIVSRDKPQKLAIGGDQWSSDVLYLNRRIVKNCTDGQSPRVQFHNATASWLMGDSVGSNTGELQIKY